MGQGCGFGLHHNYHDVIFILNDLGIIGGAVSRLSRRAILFAGALMSLPLSAFSAGLGKLTVLSNLGEPLKAEIEVVAVEKGERDSLSARLAAVEAYIQANLPYPSGAWGLKIALDTRPNGQPYVSISSANPVSEPFVDVLVDLRWNGGRLLRAYTALLDPPAYTAPETVPPATPATIASPQPEQPQDENAGQEVIEAQAQEPAAGETEPQVTTAPLNEAPANPAVELNAQATPANEPGMPADAPAAAQGASPTPVEAEKTGPTSHTVKWGDTLSKIALQVKPADVTLEQMLVVLYRTNPDAFAGNNMNRLKTGKILRLLDPAEPVVVTPREARKEIRVQTADWNAWRAKIAGTVESTPAISESSQSASGSISSKIDEKPATPVEQPKEVLKLSKGETPGDKVGAAAGGKGDAKASREQALEEEVAARQKAIADAKERFAKLENTIKDMQALMDMKSKSMADVQQSAGKEAVKPDTAASGASPVAPTGTTEPIPAAQTPALSSEPVAAAPSESVKLATKPARTKPATVTPPAESSLVQKILGEPLYLAGGAGLLALLGLGGFLAWRKRKASAEDTEESYDEIPVSPSGGERATEEMLAPRGGAKAVGDHVSEDVDAVAEADVYLAYGRDAQAEQILKDALQFQPQRQEIHLKLLEIYHKRKDVASFSPVAETLFAATRGQGDLWRKAARMGYQLDPSNSRYAGGETGGMADSDITASGSIDKLDLDLGLGQGDASTTTDIDLGDMRANAAGADLDLSNLSSSTISPDLDLRTQVLVRTGQVDLGQTANASAHTQQMPKMDMTLEMSHTQEGKAAPDGDSLDFDLDLNTLSGGANAAKAEPGGLDLDVGRIRLDATLGGESEPQFGLDGPSTSLPDVDLSTISLDLDGSQTGEGNSNGAKDEHWHDVQTKFDLAKAYQEMGDKEGAREILREVVQEGDDDQKNAAEKVLEALV